MCLIDSLYREIKPSLAVADPENIVTRGIKIFRGGIVVQW